MKTIVVRTEQQLNHLVAIALKQGKFAQKINNGDETGARILNSCDKIAYKIVVKPCGGL